MNKLARPMLQTTKSYCVTGGGVVGKTRLLPVVAETYKMGLRGARTSLRVVAPTCVAAAVAGGVKLHAFLRLTMNCFNHSLTEAEDARRLYAAMDKRTGLRLATTFYSLMKFPWFRVACSHHWCTP